MAIACDNVRRARPLLGTFVEIEVAAATWPGAEAAIDAAFDAVAQVHRLMSFHDPDSDVSRLNRQAHAGPTPVHPWTFQVLEAAVEMHRRSGGRFDVSVAPVLQAMGWLPKSSSDPATKPDAGLADVIELLPDHTIGFRAPGVTIDLGGIAKGFAVDRALDVLRGFGISGGLVNAGGDLRVFGAGAHTVHVRDPRNPGRLICSIELVDEALASTAGRVELLAGAEPGSSPVIDPATGRPTGAVAGATVRAPSCMVADALTKIVMISGTEAGDLLAHFGASALLVSPDGDLHITSDWQHAVHLAA